MFLLRIGCNRLDILQDFEYISLMDPAGVR